MFTSLEKKRPLLEALWKNARALLAAAAFCAVFGAVYLHFGHGVSSPYMAWLFAIPLAGALAPYALVLPAHPGWLPPRAAGTLWRCGAATLTVGSCLRGVFDIYGTSAALVGVYAPAGFALCTLAAGACLYGELPARDKRENRTT